MPDWTSQRISIKHIPESHIMCRCSGRTNDVHFKTLGEKTVSVLKIVRKRKSEERLPAVKQRSKSKREAREYGVRVHIRATSGICATRGGPSTDCATDSRAQIPSTVVRLEIIFALLKCWYESSYGVLSNVKGKAGFQVASQVMKL